MTKKVLTVLLIVTLCFCMFGFSKSALETSYHYFNAIEKELGYATNRILVVMDEEESLKFRSYTPDYFNEIECKRVTELTSSMKAEAKATLEQNERSSDETFSEPKYNSILCLELENSDSSAVKNAIKSLKDKNGVLYVGPDYIITTASTSVNDPDYYQQWGHAKTSIPNAWDIKKHATNVIVGVIDSGIEYNHPDLQANIHTALCRDFSTGDNIAEPIPTANNRHGTNVAGIIGALGNNNRGISGVCWTVKLVSLKIFDAYGCAYSSWLINAIDYADSNNIPILNFSGGWYSSNGLYSYYDEATYYAILNYSGLFVCSAGNEGLNIDDSSIDARPANDTAPNMIVVGASTSGDGKWNLSNYGFKSVDLFAPGADIYTTTLNNQYITDDGTSFATPYVSGVAALLLADHPSLTAAQLKSAILNNVDNIIDSSDNNIFGLLCTSGGRLNAYRTLNNYNHSHNIDYINYGHYYYHKCECDDCGNVFYKEHYWEQQIGPLNGENSLRYVPIKVCRDCGASKPAAG